MPIADPRRRRRANAIRRPRLTARAANADRRRARMRRFVRRLLDPLRRHRRVARRRRAVGIRRSAGRELEPRLRRGARFPNCRRLRAPSCRRAASRREWHERDVGTSPPHPDTSERSELPIEDNRDCASRRLPDITCPLAVRARSRSPSCARSQLTHRCGARRRRAPSRRTRRPSPDRSPTASRSTRLRRSRKRCCARSASCAGRAMRR